MCGKCSSLRGGVVPVLAALTSLSVIAQPLHFFRCHPPAKMQNFGMYSWLVEKRPLAHAGKNRLRRASAWRPHRQVTHRSTKCLGSLDVDVAGEYHAAALCRQVHAHVVKFVRDVHVM